MKKSYLLLALAIFGFGGISALHAQLDPSFLKYVKVLPGGDGRHLNTYEDVGGITFNPRVQGGAAIPFFKKSDIPTGYVSYSQHALAPMFKDMAVPECQRYNK